MLPSHTLKVINVYFKLETDDFSNLQIFTTLNNNKLEKFNLFTK